jgi:cytochrome c oxidase subunit II
MPAKRFVAVAFCVAGSLLPPAVASTSAPPQTAEPRTIEVVARRYTFEPAVIEAVEGERLRILVKSGDGLHGFEIKRFKVSKEIPRGSDPIVIEFTASEAGKFPILCSVFCGDGHDDMKGTLIVSAGAAATP